jgi:hypothetical protein
MQRGLTSRLQTLSGGSHMVHHIDPAQVVRNRGSRG